MTRSKLIGALVFALPILWAAPSAAAETGVSAADAYRLSLEKPDAFRLGALPSHPAEPTPAATPAKNSQLANRPFAALIQSAARDAGLDAALVHAVIYVESRYNQRARSNKGAIGLMQVLPETAARYGVPDPGHSAEANVRAGTRYLQDLMIMFEGRLELVLAAYNAGERAVIRFGQRVPPFPETMAYVPAVLAKYREWEEKPEIRPAPISRHKNYLPGTLLNPL